LVAEAGFEPHDLGYVGSNYRLVNLVVYLYVIRRVALGLVGLVRIVVLLGLNLP